MSWYVRTGGREIGPISEQTLRAMSATGQLDVATLVRRSDSTQWLAVAAVPAILPPPGAAPLPRRLPTPTVEAVADEVDIATPWRRLWARMLDVFLCIYLLGFVLGAVRPSLFQSGGGAAHQQLIAWLLMPVVMVLDSLIYALFGNTLGKAIAGTAVRAERGGRLPFLPYLKRNFELYFFGLGTMLPIITLVTLIGSFRRADRGELMSWDLSADSRVVARSVNPVRTWIVALVYIALVGGVWYSQLLEQTKLLRQQAQSQGDWRSQGR
jgi:uncharacterized RDD family membrane protein YckC